MIPDEYIAIMPPEFLPRTMWAPPIEEILEYIEKYKLDREQQIIVEYLLQLYSALYGSDAKQLHVIAAAIYSYVHSTKGYEYERLSSFIGSLSNTVYDLVQNIPIDKEYKPKAYLLEEIKMENIPLIGLQELGRTSNIPQPIVRTAIDQIILSLKRIIPYRLSQLTPSNRPFPKSILRIPQLFLRKKWELYRFPGKAMKSEPLFTYNLKPGEEFTWTVTEKRRRFSERIETASVVDSVSKEAVQSFEDELRKTDSVRDQSQVDNQSYVDTQTTESYGMDAKVSAQAGASMGPNVKAEVSGYYDKTNAQQTGSSIKETVASDKYSESVSTAIKRQSEKVNTARTTAHETKETVQTEETHEDSKIRKIINENPDREMRIAVYQSIVPYTLYIVIKDIDLVLSNGINIQTIQFGEALRLLKLLESPLVEPEKSPYQIIIDALSDLELMDHEGQPVKLFKQIDHVSYKNSIYPKIVVDLPKNNIREDSENEAVRLIKGLITHKEIYFMKTENTLEETELLPNDLLSPTKRREVQLLIDKIEQEIQTMILSNEERKELNEFLKSLRTDFGKFDRTVQSTIILSALNKSNGTLFENMTLLMNMVNNGEKKVRMLPE